MECRVATTFDWEWGPSTLQRLGKAHALRVYVYIYIYDYDYLHAKSSLLVGGIPTPLKNMAWSIGMMTFPVYGKS